jgi:hypothetical protein
VQIVFETPDDKAYVVSLPTAKHFLAYRANAPQRDRFDIAKLHAALLDGMGNVLLTDGTALRAVEVIPAHLPLKPTELDWRIIHRTLSIVGADRCYRHLAYGLPARLQEIIPDLRILDCGTLEISMTAQFSRFKSKKQDCWNRTGRFDSQILTYWQLRSIGGNQIRILKTRKEA